MVRILGFVAMIGLLVGIAGCQSAKKQKQQQQKEPEKVALEEVTPTKQVTKPTTAKQPASAPSTKPETVEKIQPDQPLETQKPTIVRKHIVQKGDTLYKLSRFYYGDQKYWRKIWQANIDIIPDPNKLKVGQELIIP